jgi:hypothetical protein
MSQNGGVQGRDRVVNALPAIVEYMVVRERKQLNASVPY